MGSCASVEKTPESAVRYGVKGSGFKKENGTFVAPTPELDGGFKSPMFGSKDEAFFETKAWLDSDCEDDFFSVKGDFTPSAGSTPNHQTSFPATPQLNKTIFDSFSFPDTKSEPSPRKKLSELFLETLTNEVDTNRPAVGYTDKTTKTNGKSKSPTIIPKPSPKSSGGTPNYSGTNSTEKTPNGSHKGGKEKPSEPKCCLPSMVPSFNLYERKKQRQSSSPEVRNGG